MAGSVSEIVAGKSCKKGLIDCVVDAGVKLKAPRVVAVAVAVAVAATTRTQAKNGVQSV